MSLIIENDHGTREGTGKPVTLWIDDVQVTVPEGSSVMHAASKVERPIPKLCATDSLDAWGSCRMCLVEIEGVRGTPSSCTTPVRDGMKVITQNNRLERLRKGVMELYISDHPLDCLTCPTNGDCELQDTAGTVGLREVRYGMTGENHFEEASKAPIDVSNPYFQYDPSKCIVCSRCVRACEETQGTFALTIEGRGFDSRVSAGVGMDDFFSSDCVSCGACVQACPTATLVEKSVVEHGTPSRSVVTTCAYCGVGCSFKAEMQGNELIRMVPYKDGKANEGHSCVKGRFAFGYATHKDRQTEPMIRESYTDPWQKVSWDEAIAFAANRLKAAQAKYGQGSIGGITSSRCTNEEIYVVQKMIRAAFGTNNVDTCARVCHSPTGYGLKTTLGTSAGTQTFKSVEQSDVILLIGANPTDAHPVFGSRMKKRLRDGAKSIVVDPRRIDLVKSAHIRADHHIQLRPGTNVAVMNAMAHVVVTEGLVNEAFVSERCDMEEFERWRAFAAEERNSPESLADIIGVDPQELREAARLFATGGNGAIYYGLGVTEHSQGSTMVMAMANLCMATGNFGREGVGINPLRGQNNVQGSCDMGSFPHELPGYRHVGDDATRTLFEQDWGVELLAEPGLRIPNMFAAAIDGSYKGMFVQGEDIAQSDPNTSHVEEALKALDILIVQDLFLNETAAFAHVFLPGTSFLEKDGTFTNAERRINRVRPVMKEQSNLSEWEAVCRLSAAMGYEMSYDDPSQIMDEIARLTPSFAGVSHQRLDGGESLQWPVNDANPNGSPIMHVDGFVRGKGLFMVTDYVATSERSNRFYPLLLTTGRILSQYNVGAQTRRTENSRWHQEDIIEIHPHDAEERGIADGDHVSIASRMGATTLRAEISDRVPAGVVYTTFHHPLSGANVITTDNSDWATNCPEYKVTAVQVHRSNRPSDWQEEHKDKSQTHYRITIDAAE